MITASEAEVLAHKAIEDYVNSCGCNSEDDVANVLMKIMSMTGLAMKLVVGPEETAARMIGTFEHVIKHQGNHTVEFQSTH